MIDMTLTRGLATALAVTVAIGAGIGISLLLEDDGRRVVVKGADDADGVSTAPSGAVAAPTGANAERMSATPSESPTRAAPADPDLPATDELFVNPNSSAATWVEKNPGRPRTDLIRSAIAGKPGAQWFGTWNTDLTGDVRWYTSTAAEFDQVPVLVYYDDSLRTCAPGPGRDAPTTAEHLARMRSLADGIGDSRVILLIFPWSIQSLGCVQDAGEVERRTRAMAQAVDVLDKRSPNALVYLHSSMTALDPATTAERLDQSGLADAHGFVVNVITTTPTDDLVDEASELNDAIDKRLGYRKPYVIDTSWNGRELDGDLCNSPDLRTGEAPRRGAPDEGPEYLLWFRNPGESSGDCGLGKGSATGAFLPRLAMSMAGGTDR
ncbi:MAG: glycoside hydrolase family 6 protein [Phycicoccus sp.]